MSTKISDRYRQSKSGKTGGQDGKKLTPASKSSRSGASSDTDESAHERELAVFDLTNKWGPCKGITRLERWERAEKLGLNPPQAIRDIIMNAPEADRQALNQSTWENRGI